MKITSARVRDFKSVTDSTEVELDERVTCLVGKNESGKTACLEALYRWKPLPTGHHDSFEPLRDFPRARYSLERDTLATLAPIEVTVELEEDDLKALAAEFGDGVVGQQSYTRSRRYDNTWTVSDLTVDEAAYVKARVAKAGLTAAVPEGSETVAALVQALGAISEESPDALALATELAEFELSSAVRMSLQKHYPSFLYFDVYSALPGRVSIPRLQQHEADLDSGERTALALLKLAGVATADFDEDAYEARRAALEAASNVITKQLFEYWSQNDGLLVELDLDFKSPPGLRTGEVAPFLDIRIRNLRHGVSLNFGERSAGFVWFFSFLAAFSEYRDSDEPLVLLLDEPGLGLHAAAQADLLRYIEERLAPKHQVIFSTHSPFMVDPTHLERVRTVEDVDGKGTTVSKDVLSTNRDTLFPLQAALGYELAQTLFVGPDNLVVEGPADLIYLTVMSEHLRSLGRSSLDPRWVIVPVGGLDKIPTFVALLGAHLNVAVVMDSAAGGSQKINSLIERGVIEANRVVPLNTITGGKEADIEDLFDEAFYLQLVKDSGVGTVAKTKLPAGARIVKRVEQVIGAYDHYRPARHLLETPGLLAKIDDPTLDRFADLFERLNALLD
jgi:hypothetical protein